MMARNSIRRVVKADYSLLEGRRLLAGNIRAFENGHLYIRGDANNNQFEIVVDANELKINGLDGTTINGDDSYTVVGASITATGVTFKGGLRAHLGHDQLSVFDAMFEDLSIVYGGTGDDNIEIAGSRFAGDALFQTFDGDDSIMTSQTQFDGEFRAITLGGVDTVTMSNTTMQGSSFVVTGNQEDGVFLKQTQYMGETNLVLPLDGDDTVELDHPVVMEQLGIFLGDGDDIINADLTQATVHGAIRIGGQQGSDEAPEMQMSEEVVDNVIVNTVESREVFDGGADISSPERFGLLSLLNESTNDGDRYATPIVLESTERITSVEWTGYYERDLFNSGQSGPEDRFVIEIYEAAGDGAPNSGTLIQFEAGTANRADSGQTGQVITSGVVTNEYPIYEYSADVDFTMEAGKQYFVSIYTVLGSGDYNGWWFWAAENKESSAFETLHRLTWTPDDATTGDNDWRFGGEGEKQPNYWYGADMDIRLRT